MFFALLRRQRLFADKAPLAADAIFFRRYRALRHEFSPSDSFIFNIFISRAEPSPIRPSMVITFDIDISRRHFTPHLFSAAVIRHFTGDISLFQI